jgi:hypothetical protein
LFTQLNKVRCVAAVITTYYQCQVCRHLLRIPITAF